MTPGNAWSLTRRLATVAGATVLAAACGSSSTTQPSPPVAGATVTITASGVTPKNLLVSAGAQVRFVNNDARDHEIASDPHPDHTDCPAINNVGFIVPGQSKETGNLNERRTCGFHDHMHPEDGSLRGVITIQ